MARHILICFSLLVACTQADLQEDIRRSSCNIQMHTKLGREPRLVKIEAEDVQEVVLYLRSSDGAICTKMKGSVSVLVIYKKTTKKTDGYIFSKLVPSNAQVEGSCDKEDTSVLNITWNEYSLVWNFAKTPGRKRWYVSQVDLIINTRTEGMKKFAFCGKSFTFSTPEPIFPTPLGYSHRIFPKSALNLVLTEGKDAANFTAQIYLKNFQLQPFMNSSQFGPLFEEKAVANKTLVDETKKGEDTKKEEQTKKGEGAKAVEETTTETTTEMETSSTSTVETTTFLENLTTTQDTTTFEYVVVYELEDKCVVMKTDGLLELIFKLPTGELHNTMSYLPEEGSVEGSCSSKEAWMRISWKNYAITWNFLREESLGWWVSQVQVDVSASEHFEGLLNRGMPLKFVRNNDKILYRKIGCGYKAKELSLELHTEENVKQYQTTAKLHLRNFYLAAFLESKNQV